MDFELMSLAVFLESSSLIVMMGSLSFVGGSLFLSGQLKIPVQLALLVYVCSAVCMLYIFALFGFLHLAAGFFCGVGMLGLLASIWVLSAKNLFSGLLDLCLFVLPILLLWGYIPADFFLTYNDDLSHWGLSIKDLFYRDGLYEAGSAVYFQSYPPGSGLFQYLMASIYGGGFSEKFAVLAHASLLLLCISSVMSLSLRNRFWVFLMSPALLYLLLSVFGYSFFSLYVDSLLGVAFAVAITVVWRYGVDLRVFLILVPVLAMLVLIKHTGLVFSLLIFGIVLVVCIFSGSRAFIGKETRKQLLYPLALLVVIVAVFVSWKLYVVSIGAEVDLSGVADEETPGDKFSRVITAFLGYASGGEFLLVGQEMFLPGIAISPLYLFLVLLVVGFAFVRFGHGDGRGVVFALLLPVCCLMYACFLIYAYISFFMYYEAVRLASFDRYLAAFFLAWLLFGVAVFVRFIGEAGGVLRHLKLACFLFVLFFVAPKGPGKFIALPDNSHNQDLINKVTKLSVLVKEHIIPGENVYFIDQDSSGYSSLLFRYVISPYRSNFWCWSLRECYKPSHWTCDKSLEEALEGYAFLVINYSDDLFWDQYSDIFNKVDRGTWGAVYYVSRRSSQGIELIHIPFFGAEPIVR